MSTEAALSDLCKDLNCSQTGNPDAALSVVGDFKHLILRRLCLTSIIPDLAEVKVNKLMMHAPSDTRGQEMVRPIRGRPTVSTT